VGGGGNADQSRNYPKILDRAGRSDPASIVIGIIWSMSIMSMQLCRRASAGEDESLVRLLDERAQREAVCILPMLPNFHMTDGLGPTIYLCVRTSGSRRKAAADSADYPKVLDRVGRSNLLSIVIGSIWSISAMSRQQCRRASVAEDERPFRLIDRRASSSPK
jgi:hypothetical protein